MRPNIALQRTPLARPLGWARFLGPWRAASRAGSDACQQRR